MRIPRLFVPAALAESTTLNLDAELSSYLNKVLRLKRGQELTVFNGEGGEYAARILATARDQVTIAVGQHRSREAESPLFIHLGLAISRGDRMDVAIQKAVELGVGRITPLLTERTVVRLEPGRREQRSLHWEKIIKSACEQCGRNRLPDLDIPQPLAEWLSQAEGQKLFFDPAGTQSLAAVARVHAPLSLLSGPEGGFSERERRLILDAAFLPVRLGPRILRAETAVLAALSVVQSLWGDLR